MRPMTYNELLFYAILFVCFLLAVLNQPGCEAGAGATSSSSVSSKTLDL
jgi:preprotein translocase subunit SecG